MNILITGGAGFIGSHIADAYLRKGFRVVIVDDLSTGKRENLPEGAEFYRISILAPELEEIIKKERPQIINHHAAQVDVRKSVADPFKDALINVLGTIKILQYSASYGVKKIIFASSGGAVYGEQDYFPADENHPLRPISPYGASKASCEVYINNFSIMHGIKAVNLRYGNVYGPRQDPYGEAGVIAIFIMKVLSGQTPVVNGDGMQTRDFVFVEDVVDANLIALREDIEGTFNIGTGKEHSVIDILNIIQKNLGRTIHWTYAPAKPGEQRRSCLDIRKAREKMGWCPKVSVEDGIRKTIEFFNNPKNIPSWG